MIDYYINFIDLICLCALDIWRRFVQIYNCHVANLQLLYILQALLSCFRLHKYNSHDQGLVECDETQ